MPRPFCLLCLLFCALAAEVSAWHSAAGVTAQPPASHVLDPNGVFHREPERLEAISQRLIRLRNDHRIEIYLVCHAGLLRGSVVEQALALQQAWIPHDNGFVIVCDIYSRELEIGYPDDAVLPEPPRGNENEKPLPSLQRYQLSLVLQDIDATLAEEDEPTIYLENLVNRIADIFEARASTPVSPAREAAESRFRLLVIGSLLAAVAIFLALSRWVRKSDLEAKRRYFLPDVVVGMRLGAPYGGGLTSSRTYGTPPPQSPAEPDAAAGDGEG